MSELVVTTLTTSTINASSATVSFSANGLVLPSGNTSVRPTGANGAVRWNSETNKIEGYAYNGWQDLSLSINFGTRSFFKANDVEIAEDVTFEDKAVAVTSLNTNTEVITCAGHQFVNGDVVQVRATIAIPAGTSSNTNYYITNTSGDTFTISTTRGGANVDITSVGSGTVTFYKPVNVSVVGPYTVANTYTLTVANGSTMVVL